MKPEKVFCRQSPREESFCSDAIYFLSREVTKLVKFSPYTNTYECPVCWTEVKEGNYCPFCGQHITIPKAKEKN